MAKDFRFDASAQGSKGLRNNNPLNLRPPTDTFYQGQIGRDSSRMGIFKNVAYGIRAAALDLTTDYTKKNLKTIQKLINEFAPASDGNNPVAYALTVANYAGFNKDAVFALNANNLVNILDGMRRVELGSKYSDRINKEDIIEGVQLANLPGSGEIVKDTAFGIGTFLLLFFGYRIIKNGKLF